ncbi:MAG: PEP-CTERM sorting domain-containing protein [Akkermansia sp.]
MSLTVATQAQAEDKTLTGDEAVTYTDTVATTYTPDTFTGELTVAEGSSGLTIIATADTESPTRYDLQLNADVTIENPDVTGAKTLYLSSLNGDGNITVDGTLNWKHSDINLQMSDDNTWNGEVLISNSYAVSGFRIDSVEGEHCTFTMTKGMSYTADNLSYSALNIDDATVKLTGYAQWNSGIHLNEATSRLVLGYEKDVTIGSDAATVKLGIFNGAGTIEINTASTVSMARANESFTGSYQVVNGTLELADAAALGSANVVMSGGKLAFADDVSVKLKNGKSLTLDTAGDFESNITNLLGDSTSLKAAIAGGGEVSISKDALYTRTSSGFSYTVDVAADTTLTDNVDLVLSNSKLTVSGEGQYVANSLTAGSGSLGNADINGNLKLVNGATLAKSANSTVNVNGTLDVQSQLNFGTGTAVVNVKDGATLALGENLTTTVGTGSATVNVADGAKLSLSNGVNTSDVIKFSVANGGTVSAAGASSVGSLTLAAGASVTGTDSAKLDIEQLNITASTNDSLAIATNVDGAGFSYISYTISSLSDVVVEISNSITVNLTLTEGQYADFAGTMSNIDNAEMLARIIFGEDYFTITIDGLEAVDENTTFNLVVSDGTETMTVDSAKVFTNAKGDVVFVVPEPSTATLSLLALAGLCARRRRKA